MSKSRVNGLSLRDLEESLGRRIIMSCAVCGARRPSSVSQRSALSRDVTVFTIECHGQREEVEIDGETMTSPGFTFTPFASARPIVAPIDWETGRRQALEGNPYLPPPRFDPRDASERAFEREYLSNWKSTAIFDSAWIPYDRSTRWPIMVRHGLGTSPPPEGVTVYFRDDFGSVMELEQDQWGRLMGEWLTVNTVSIIIDIADQMLQYNQVRVRAMMEDRPKPARDDLTDALSYSTRAFIKEAQAKPTVPVSAEILDALQRAARGAGLSLEEYLREAARISGVEKTVGPLPPWAPGQRRIKLSEED